MNVDAVDTRLKRIERWARLNGYFNIATEIELLRIHICGILPITDTSPNGLKEPKP